MRASMWAALALGVVASAAAADRVICSVPKDDSGHSPGNCTAAGAICCPDSGWDFSSNYTRFLGRCYDDATEMCVSPQPHCSPCVSVPCVRVCPRTANVSCGLDRWGECMDPATQTCCGGTICNTAHGEACARDGWCSGGACCAPGTSACTAPVLGSKGVCCVDGTQKCGTDEKGYAKCVDVSM